MVQPYQSGNASVLNSKMKAIENYGRMYVANYLDKDRRRLSSIMSHPLDALTFLYGKVFMRGRRDAISVIFMNRTIEVLGEYTSIHDLDLSSLEKKLSLHGVNNRNDRRMVIESIRFILENLQNYDYNIFKWTVDSIRTNCCPEVFLALTDIHAIGDKLATFYFRDVALVSDLELTIQSESYIYFQPIDTWVKQVANAIGITKETDQNLDVKEKIIVSCFEAEVSPLLFNAGAWMAGAKAFQLLIERL